MRDSLRSWKAILITGLLVPPIGLFLLWKKPGIRLAGRLAVSVAILLASLGHLWYFFGLKAELDGSAVGLIVSFHKPEAHEDSIDRNRVEVASKLPPRPSIAPEKALVRGAEWADYRGPGRAGNYTLGPILTDWPAGGLPRLWKQPSGGGYASFSIANGVAFTIEQRRSQEVVAAYDIDTGRELWKHGWDAYFRESLGGDGPRATPVWHDGKVYALGAEGELRCLDARSGSKIWSRNILEGASNLQWGMAASPLVFDDKVVVSAADRLAAYNRLTGEPIWKGIERRMTYVSPMLTTLAGRRQILHVSAYHALGIAPEDGTLLWEHAWGPGSDIKSAQPLVLGGDRVYVSSGYGQGSAVFEVQKQGESFSTTTVWENIRMKNKFASAVLHEGHIYGLDEAILACVDAATGELKWKGGRYGYGQLILAGEHLIVLTEGGDVVLVKATPASHSEVSRFTAIEGKTWNIPAISDGLLLVRNTTEMACFRVGR